MPDTIDINITPIVETVTLTIQSNLTTINVNTVGGGGSQNLQEVTDELLVGGFAETTNGIKALEFKTDNFYVYQGFGFAYSDDNDGFENFKYQPYGLGMTFSNSTDNGSSNINSQSISLTNLDNTNLIGLGDSKLYFYDVITNKNISLSFPSSIVGTDKTVTFRDLSGTVAYLSDIPSPITIDATPTDGSSNAVSSNGVFDALALRKRRIITDTTSVVVSGTTGLVLAKTYELTAGTLSASGFLDVYMFSSRTAGGGGHSMGLYINTTNNFGTATLIATMATAGNFNPHLPAKLQYILKDNLLMGGLFSSTTGSNMPSSATRVSVACNNTSASVWLFVGVTASSGQTITLEGVEILN